MELYIDGAHAGSPAADADALALQIQLGGRRAGWLLRTCRAIVRATPALAIAALPKCPVCLAMYLSSFGLAAAAPWVAPVVYAITIVVAAVVVWMAVRARRIAPAMVWIGGVALLVAGLRWLGLPLALTGALWQAYRSTSIRPRRSTG